MTTHRINGLVIETTHEFPPIPIRSFDWSAVLDSYDGAIGSGWQPVGSGKTEEAAIADLLAQIEEYDDAYAEEEAADMRREERGR